MRSKFEVQMDSSYKCAVVSIIILEHYLKLQSFLSIIYGNIAKKLYLTWTPLATDLTMFRLFPTIVLFIFLYSDIVLSNYLIAISAQ